MENRRGEGKRAVRTVHSERTGEWGQEEGRQARHSKRTIGGLPGNGQGGGTKRGQAWGQDTQRGRLVGRG
jgi:hypothetical protein